jgi:hypothetical protein
MSIQKFDHHLQAEIFAKLRHNQKLRFKDLKNPELESSQFMYHLKGLMAQKLVEKTNDGYYILSQKGIGLAQHFSSALGNLNEAPLSYTLLFIRTSTNKWFILRRQKQPHISKLACISGKIRMDETIKQAVEREMLAFTSQDWQDKIEYRGFASVLIRGKTGRTHITGPIWLIDGVDEVPLPEFASGKGEWLNWKELSYEEFIPGWREIVEMIESGKPSYLDLEFKV